MREKLLLFLSLLMTGSSVTYGQLVAKILRPKNEARIPGLFLRREIVPVKVSSGKKGRISITFDLDFLALGRTLLSDEVVFETDPKSTQKQSLKLTVYLTGKVTSLLLLATDPQGQSQKEKMLISFEGWTAEMTRSTLESELSAEDPRFVYVDMLPGGRGYKNQILVGPYFSYFGIRATDKQNGGEAQISSLLNYGLKLSGRFAWLPTLEPLFSASLTRAIFEEVPVRGPSPNRSLLWNIQVGTSYYPFFTRRLRFAGLLGMQSEPAVLATDPVHLSLFSASLPTVSLKAFYEIVKGPLWSLEVELFGAGFLSGGKEPFIVRNGKGFGGKLLGIRQLRDGGVRAALSYEKYILNAVHQDQSRSELGVELDWIIRW